LHVNATTGEELEEELLRSRRKKEAGVAALSGKERPKKKRENKKGHLGRAYVDYERSLQLAMRHQPWGNNPRCPGTPFLKEMYNCIAPQLTKGSHRLRIFLAVGTPFDHWHGVDFFFEYEGIVVTVDVTIRPGKDKYHADILITRNDILCDAHHKKAQEIGRILKRASRCG
jgi:hypothetical protein